MALYLCSFNIHETMLDDADIITWTLDRVCLCAIITKTISLLLLLYFISRIDLILSLVFTGITIHVGFGFKPYKKPIL